MHGLRGSIETTWRHNRTGAYWPRDFLSKNLSNCRIFAFGYDADIVNLWNPASKNRISNHAGNLIGALAGEREITDTVSGIFDGLIILHTETCPRRIPGKLYSLGIALGV